MTHEAPTRRKTLMDSPAFRTFIEGVAIDVALALCLVVVAATTSDHVDWRVLGALALKTVLHTMAASVLKRLRPVQA